MLSPTLKTWLKVTIDIDCPTSIIRTDEGDLILDDAYANKIYVNEILVEDGGRWAEFESHGYNFNNWYLDRERRALTSVKRRSLSINAIWAAVLRKPGGKHISTYTDLIFKKQNKSADVMLNGDDLSLDEDSLDGMESNAHHEPRPRRPSTLLLYIRRCPRRKKNDVSLSRRKYLTKPCRMFISSRKILARTRFTSHANFGRFFAISTCVERHRKNKRTCFHEHELLMYSKASSPNMYCGCSKTVFDHIQRPSICKLRSWMQNTSE